MNCEHKWEEVKRKEIVREVRGCFYPGQAPTTREIIIGNSIELKCKNCGDIKFVKEAIDD